MERLYELPVKDLGKGLTAEWVLLNLICHTNTFPLYVGKVCGKKAYMIVFQLIWKRKQQVK